MASLSTPTSVSESAAAPRQVLAAGHEWTIFVETPPLIDAMVRDIRSAQRRVWVEVYIFLNDATGKIVAEALKERARAGLDVRVLYDAIGSQWAPPGFFLDMERAGVQVHAFHSFWEAFWKFAPLKVLNRRNHRKLLVIDDAVAYFGGMNLTDPSPLAAEDRRQPWSTAWRDVHVRLAGPQQAEVAESFERSWLRAKKKKVKPRPREYRQAVLATAPESIQFFDSGPGRRHTRSARIFDQLFRAARKRITMAMAYFLPVGGVLRQLLQAHRRGVFVQVVVPGQSDVRIVYRATRFLYAKLLRKRFHIYERQVCMFHGKVTVVDDEWVVLGSSNLDARSLFINLEFLAVVRSRALAAVMKEIIREEMRRSRRIRLRDYLRSKCEDFLLDRMAWWFRWWL